MRQFEVGKTYECTFYKGVDVNGNLVFDRTNPDYWEETTAKIIKRTKRTITIEIPGWENVYRPRVDTSMDDIEQVWTYTFRMYANWEVT
jgi:hypothetical protein